MFCEKCGSKLPENAKFCAGCGAKAELAQPIASQPQAQYTPPATTYQTSPVQESSPQVRAYAPAPAYSPAQSIEILSVKQYMVMLLLLCIPIVNFFYCSCGALAAQQAQAKTLPVQCLFSL